MRILFLHQNFPGQFVHVAQALQQMGGHELLALVPEGNRRPPLIPTRTYAFAPRRAGPATHLLSHFANRVERGAAVADALHKLRSDGFMPDLVLGHGGWGETLFVKDVWPEARLLLHAELCYAAEKQDVNFDPEFSTSVDHKLRMQVRLRNTAMLQSLLDADQGVAPTQWQAGSFPGELRGKVTVLHEGIPTDLIRPDPGATVNLRRENVVLRPGDEVITFVARNLEPYRGYHVFMRALPEILARRPNARAVIVGGDGVSYGRAPPGKTNWKQTFLKEVEGRLDMARVHFVGKVPHPIFVQLMQISAVHIYLTYPFVLSWSMLEAMSAGALVIGSRTPPVEEVIKDGHNGLLRDFFDVGGIAEAAIGVLSDPAAYQSLRQVAREEVTRHFDLRQVCLPHWLRLVGRLGTRSTAGASPSFLGSLNVGPQIRVPPI